MIIFFSFQKLKVSLRQNGGQNSLYRLQGPSAHILSFTSQHTLPPTWATMSYTELKVSSQVTVIRVTDQVHHSVKQK